MKNALKSKDFTVRERDDKENELLKCFSLKIKHSSYYDLMYEAEFFQNYYLKTSVCKQVSYSLLVV